MKMIVTSSALYKSCKELSAKLIVRNPVIQILECFLFIVADRKLNIIASDLQNFASTCLDVETSPNAQASICVPGKDLVGLLKSIDEQPITIEINEENLMLDIVTDTGTIHVAGQDMKEFPAMPTLHNGQAIFLSSKVLDRALDQTLFACTTDELRPAMMGVYLESDKKVLSFTATDGHRLITYTVSGLESMPEHAMIIPAKTLKLVRALLPKKDSVVVINHFLDAGSQHSGMIAVNDFEIIFRIIDKKYPDYRAVVPKDNDNIIDVDRVKTLAVLKRMLLSTNKTTRQIKMFIHNDEVKLVAEDLDLGKESHETIKCSKHDGSDLLIGFNCQFLIEMFSNLLCSDVRIEMSKPNRAALLKPAYQDPHENVVMLCMPVMIMDFDPSPEKAEPTPEPVKVEETTEEPVHQIKSAEIEDVPVCPEPPTNPAPEHKSVLDMTDAEREEYNKNILNS